MKLSKEQEAIIRSSGNIRINAVAGSGKTTTVIEYAKVRPSDTRILYLAFNKSVKLEASVRFSEAGLHNVKTETAHSLAYKAVVFKHQYTVRAQGYKTHELAALLGLDIGGEKHSLYILANHVIKFMGYFCNSDANKVQELNYLDQITDDKARLFVKNHYTLIEQQTRQILARMDRGEIDITHDFYLKKFQLSNPVLPYDLILFDEAQDASPAMLDIFMKQPAVKVIVGDTHQQIYGWRNAVNSLEQADYPTHLLGSSFRFSEDIARLAMAVLDWKSHLGPYTPVPILGKGRAAEVKSKAILARTNLGLLLRAIEFVTEHPNVQKIYFEGNIHSYTYADDGSSLYDVLNLHLQKTHLIKDPLMKQMKDLEELDEYVGNTEDAQLAMMLEIVREYWREIPDIIRSIKERHVANSERHTAEMVFSTVHRCKGMEYDEVTLVDDFTGEEGLLKRLAILKDGDGKAKLNEDINLLYVAITRTRNLLYIPENLLPSGFPALAQIHPVKAPAKEDPILELPPFEPTAYFRKTTKARTQKTSGNKADMQPENKAGRSHSGAYQPWSSSLDRELSSLFIAGKSITELAQHFGRSKGAVWARVRKLNLEDHYRENG